MTTKDTRSDLSGKTTIGVGASRALAAECGLVQQALARLPGPAKPVRGPLAAGRRAALPERQQTVRGDNQS
jgi:hypothetical protein